jgi:phosphate transport system permease protein
MSRSRLDAVVTRALGVVAALSCGLIALIVLFLVVQAWPALETAGMRLFTDDAWRPTRQGGPAEFGLGPLIMGTLAITVGAVALAAPLGLASAVFCQFYAPPMVGVAYRRMIELLAGIPSVVFGFWGLVVLAPLVSRFRPPGQSLLTGALVVGLMILPTIMLVATAAVAAVPKATIQGGAALGLRRWTIVRRLAIPAARQGIAAGIVLGAARAMGETMAVMMVCGNVVQVPRSLFDPMRTLTANIALEMGYALGVHRGALFASGLALLCTAIGLVAITDALRRPGLAGGKGHLSGEAGG